MIRVDGLEEPPVRVALEAVLRVVPKEMRIELTRREILLLLRREFGVGMQPQPEPRVPEPPQPRHGFDAAPGTAEYLQSVHGSGSPSAIDAAPGTDEYTARAVRPRSMRRGGCLLAAFLWRELSLLAC